MGCGKSKHDVASGNTVLQRKKSSVGQENGTENKDKNNNVDNVSTRVEVEQKESENVKEVGVGGKADECNDVEGEAEKTYVQEENALEKSKEADGAEGKRQEIVVAEGPSEKSEEDGKDDSLNENDQKVNDADADAAGAAEERKPAEDEKEDVNVKEETLAKEEDIKDTNVSTIEGEEKDLKAEEGQ